MYVFNLRRALKHCPTEAVDTGMVRKTRLITWRFGKNCSVFFTVDIKSDSHCSQGTWCFQSSNSASAVRGEGRSGPYSCVMSSQSAVPKESMYFGKMSWAFKRGSGFSNRSTSWLIRCSMKVRNTFNRQYSHADSACVLALCCCLRTIRHLVQHYIILPTDMPISKASGKYHRHVWPVTAKQWI